MARVLCLGLVAADFVMTLDELPRRVEKYRARAARIDVGGAARMAAAVAALGGEAALAGRIGDDDLGHMIEARLEARGVDCSRLRLVRDMVTPFTSVLIDDAGGRQIVNYRDPGLHATAAGLEENLTGFDGLLADTRWPRRCASPPRPARWCAPGTTGRRDCRVVPRSRPCWRAIRRARSPGAETGGTINAARKQGGDHHGRRSGTG